MKHLNRAQIRYIEHELYYYEQSKRELIQLREEITDSGGAIRYDTINVSGGGPGNPTESKVIKLMSSPAIAHLSRTVTAVETSLDILTDKHRDLFNLKYILRFDAGRICREMPTSERSYYRMRQELIEMVAHAMGIQSHGRNMAGTTGVDIV
ncbi:hypothetical protein FDZ71_03420 [bacterium]|nr:MAG: hypothetical protein FDZ71_03420 [bacterium]